MNEGPRLFAGRVALITGFCTGAYLPANGGVIMP